MSLENDRGAEIIWTRINDVVNEPRRTLPPIEGYETKPLVSLEEAVQPIKKILEGIEKKVSEAKMACTNPGTDGLSIDESASIRLYTMGWLPRDRCLYFVLNKTLRDEDRDKLKPWFLFLRLFISGLTKLNRTIRHIFRGVNMDWTQPFVIGEKVTWWAFSSSTEFLHVLKRQSFLGQTGERTLFYIESYSAVDIRHHSRYPNESELLLLPASQFLVVSSLDLGHGLHIVHLKEIEPKYPRPDQIAIVAPPSSGPVTTNEPKSLISTKQIDVILHNSNLQRSIHSYPYRSSIDLSKQHLIDEDIPIIVREAMEEKQCTKLDLRNNDITWFGIAILAEAIRHNITLEELNLSQNHLNDASLFQVTKALLVTGTVFNPIYQCCGMTKIMELNKAPIKILDLSDNDITDEGVRYLAEVIKKKRTLTILYLNDNRIGNQGMKDLADALSQQGTNLEKLYLQNNEQINNESVNILIKMFKENQSLTTFWLNNCNIDDAGKETLQNESSSKKNFFF